MPLMLSAGCRNAAGAVPALRGGPAAEPQHPAGRGGQQGRAGGLQGGLMTVRLALISPKVHQQSRFAVARAQ